MTPTCTMWRHTRTHTVSRSRTQNSRMPDPTLVWLKTQRARFLWTFLLLLMVVIYFFYYGFYVCLSNPFSLCLCLSVSLLPSLTFSRSLSPSSWVPFLALELSHFCSHFSQLIMTISLPISASLSISLFLSFLIGPISVSSTVSLLFTIFLSLICLSMNQYLLSLSLPPSLSLSLLHFPFSPVSYDLPVASSVIVKSSLSQDSKHFSDTHFSSFPPTFSP